MQISSQQNHWCSALCWSPWRVSSRQSWQAGHTSLTSEFWTSNLAPSPCRSHPRSALSPGWSWVFWLCGEKVSRIASRYPSRGWIQERRGSGTLQICPAYVHANFLLRTWTFFYGLESEPTSECHKGSHMFEVLLNGPTPSSRNAEVLHMSRDALHMWRWKSLDKEQDQCFCQLVKPGNEPFLVIYNIHLDATLLLLKEWLSRSLHKLLPASS